MKKRLMASILTVVMILTMLPVSALADGADTEPVEGVVTAHKDLVRDESGAPIVDEEGNYIVELSVQGNPYQIATQSAADVVLVIDNSGSMSGTKLENMALTALGVETSMDKFLKAGLKPFLLALLLFIWLLVGGYWLVKGVCLLF